MNLNACESESILKMRECFNVINDDEASKGMLIKDIDKTYSKYMAEGRKSNNSPSNITNIEFSKTSFCRKSTIKDS